MKWKATPPSTGLGNWMIHDEAGERICTLNGQPWEQERNARTVVSMCELAAEPEPEEVEGVEC